MLYWPGRLGVSGFTQTSRTHLPSTASSQAPLLPNNNCLMFLCRGVVTCAGSPNMVAAETGIRVQSQVGSHSCYPTKDVPYPSCFFFYLVLGFLEETTVFVHSSLKRHQKANGCVRVRPRYSYSYRSCARPSITGRPRLSLHVVEMVSSYSVAVTNILTESNLRKSSHLAYTSRHGLSLGEVRA